MCARIAFVRQLLHLSEQPGLVHPPRSQIQVRWQVLSYLGSWHCFAWVSSQAVGV